MLSRLAQQVQRTILKYRMVEDGGRILVAVSGGADSVCLLHVLTELHFVVGVAHLNHGLRGADSDADENFTRELAATLNVPFFSWRAQIAVESGNLEDAGRQARKNFFSEVAEREGFPRIAIAHTRDDRAETFLLNLFRGSGLEGLVSMPAVSGKAIRPLIEIGRNEVEAYLRDRGQSWRTDASNRDLSFARNRLRHVVIPELASEFNPRLVETLSRTVQILESEDAWIRARAERWLDENGVTRGEEFAIPLGTLPGEADAFVRRVLRGALRRVGSSLDSVSFDHIQTVLGLLAEGKSGKLAVFPGGFVAERSFDTLIFRRNTAPVSDYDYTLTIPGRIVIPEIRMAFSADYVGPEGRKTEANRVLIDGDALGPCVRIRNWKWGDFYRPMGLPAGKLKKLFLKARIPRSQRRSWPILVSDSQIVWVASFPASRDFVPSAHSRKIVAFEASPI